MKIPLDKMAIVNSHFGLAIQYIVCLIIGFNVQLTHSGDKNQLTGGGGGGGGLLSILGGSTEQAEPPSPYLRDLTGFWSYNDSTDLSKYEDFDHAKFLERPFQKVGGSAIGKPAASLTSADDDTKRQLAASADQLDQAANSLPVFDNDMVTNITAQLGGTAFLHCRVRKLGERSVSWVRRRDWHILTSGVLTYTNDERFQVVHEDNSDDWNLQIKYVQKRDNGTYECQVATGSGTISHYFNLHVVVPSAYILGSGEYHIGEGSTISLVCIIENSPQPPQYVFWYHNERMINYDTATGRGGVTVSTEPGPKTHSRLVVNRATHADSGNYTCRASNTQHDTIHVFVSKGGDNTAAIQRQESAAPLLTSLSALPFLFSLLVLSLSS